MNITVSDLIVRYLERLGIDVIFGMPGAHVLPVYDSLFHSPVNTVLAKHEQGASFMAGGYARMAHRPAACIATAGPGATNLVTGLADAQIDSTPVVCITGQVPRHLLGSDAFQETDIIGISTPVTKWNYQITKASEIPEVIARAFFIARSGRPGPVLVDITKNAQFEELQNLLGLDELASETS